jgi:hypothetical protein
MRTDDFQDIEIMERTDACGRHVLEIREVGDRVPSIPNERILGIGYLARRIRLEGVGNFETGEITFRQLGRAHALSRGCGE